MAIFKRKNQKEENEKKAQHIADEKPVVAKKTEKTKSKKTAESKERKTSKETKIVAVQLGAKGSEFILKPLITEKTATLASTNKYVFVVSKDANKIQISHAISSMYGVVPDSVNIQNVRGKQVRFGRTRGTRRNWKKAIVTLPKGKTINVYDGV